MRAFLIVATSLVSLLAQSAPRVTTVRLYVFDCGVLVRGEPTAYGLTKEQVGDTNFADACYLVAHPKGTLLWDVGIIPDAQITPGGVSIAVGTSGNSNRATRTLRSQLAEIGYRPDGADASVGAKLQCARGALHPVDQGGVPRPRRPLRTAPSAPRLREFVDHYRAERNHQGIGNELIEQPPNRRTGGPVRRRQRVGGILNYYYQSAA